MMNRGVLQSSPVQQMMAAGNPSWWNINNLMRPPIISTPPPAPNHQYYHNHYHHHQQQQQQLSPSSCCCSTTNFQLAHNNNDDDNNNNNNSHVFQAHHQHQYNMNNMSTTTPSSSSWQLDDHTNHHHHEPHHHLPESWRQLLLGGVCMGDEQEQVILHQHQAALVDVKQENSSVDSYSNNHNNNNNMSNNVYTTTTTTTSQDQDFQQIATAAKATNWSTSTHPHQMNNILPASSPQSCVTTFSSSNSMLDFSSKPTDSLHARHPPPDRSSECNSGTNNGGALKKAKVQPSSTQPTFKVRKEKLGDRITALHQLVSPFGKTDTASVLLEAIGYIRFLQNQIEALSLPYLSSGAGNKRQPQPVQGERNCIFPEDPGQLLNDNCLKRKGGPDQDSYEEPKDLRSRGLCLVPVSCTLHVGSDNGADYWAPAALGGGFR